MLPRLVNALAEQGELVLVLDDFHRLASAASRESLAWFVDNISSSNSTAASSTPPPTAFEQDRDRDADLLNAGFSTLRITNHRLTHHHAKEARRLRHVLRTRSP